MAVIIGCGQKNEEKPKAEQSVKEAAPAATAAPVAPAAPAAPAAETAKPKAVTEKKEAAAAPAAAAPAPKSSGYETARLSYVKANGVPASFKMLANPLKSAAEGVEKGREIFKRQCALCHGNNGLGDSPAGKSLKPPASNLALLAAEPVATEQYIFWALTEGGAPVKSVMPQFKSLPENDRWSLAVFIKTELIKGK